MKGGCERGRCGDGWSFFYRMNLCLLLGVTMYAIDFKREMNRGRSVGRFVAEIFFKVFFNIRVCYIFFISLSHMCFKGMFIFYVNL